jgi:subtilisin family serine protease
VAGRPAEGVGSAGAEGGNLALIGAPRAWARGITGKDVVVAVLDSGVDLSHPDLKTRWRGGANSWFDPYGESPDAPIDLNGHGTQVLGVILGGGAGGSPIGVAPGARWIAAKVFDTRGRATVDAIHQALRWVLDPDGDPATDDAPDIVNNSWAAVIGLCRDEFTDDLRALRAAGILPVFAAGVDGQAGPANTPAAFAVGALTNADSLSPDSPFGPSACADKPVFPEVVAPSGEVRTSDLFGTYITLEGGTSIAAAHVSGALALLLEADPTLTPDEQARLLEATAVDLGEAGPDNAFGHGRIDVAAALDRVLGPTPASQAAQATVEAPAVRPDLGPGAGAALAAAGMVAVLGLGWLLVRRLRK